MFSLFSSVPGYVRFAAVMGFGIASGCSGDLSEIDSAGDPWNETVAQLEAESAEPAGSDTPDFSETGAGDPSVESDVAEGTVAVGDAAEGTVAVAAPLGTVRQALFDRCDNVDVRVTNLREEPSGARPAIKVTRLSIWNVDKARWELQQVTNREIGYNSSDLFVEDLEEIDGEPIGAWRVYYKYDLGNGWSSETNEYINTTDVNCSDGMNVYLTVRY
jgi:hypothetical protein